MEDGEADRFEGNHSRVRLGHSSADKMEKSYKKGEFFFQILYSGMISKDLVLKHLLLTFVDHFLVQLKFIF